MEINATHIKKCLCGSFLTHMTGPWRRSLFDDLPEDDCDNDPGDGVDYDQEPDTVTEATVE